jgi:hypothetical protein
LRALIEGLVKDNQRAPNQPPERPDSVPEFSPLQPEDYIAEPSQPVQPMPASDSNVNSDNQIKFDYFDQEILHGLEKIPAPNHPGTLIVTGDSQPIFTGKTPGELFLAASEYGN